MDAHRSLLPTVAHIVDVPLTEDDRIADGPRRLGQPAPPGLPYCLVETTLDDGEGPRGRAVIVQLRALIARPRDEPDIDPIVRVDPGMPPLVRIRVHLVETGADLIGDTLDELHQIGEIEGGGGDASSGHVSMETLDSPRSASSRQTRAVRSRRRGW